MKKKIISKALTGFTIENAIEIFISLLLRGGSYLPYPSQLVAMAGSEIFAVLLQYVLRRYVSKIKQILGM